GIVAATDAAAPAAADRALSPAGPAGHRPSAGGSVDGAATARPPGARPTRRIVLPPRTFASQTARAGRPPAEGRALSRQPASVSTRNALLPTRFGYADESFDALVAWDI